MSKNYCCIELHGVFIKEKFKALDIRKMYTEQFIIFLKNVVNTIAVLIHFLKTTTKKKIKN